MSDDEFFRTLLTEVPSARPAFRAELRDHVANEWRGHTTNQTEIQTDFQTAERPRQPRSLWTIGTAAVIVAFVMAGLVWAARSDDPGMRPVDTPPAPSAPDVSSSTPAETGTFPDPTSPVVPDDETAPDIEAARSAVNGWLVVQIGDGLSFVRPGEDGTAVDVPGSANVEEPCPAWSPDGTKLSFGRSTSSTPGRLGPATRFSDTELVIVPVDGSGVVGAPTVITLDGFDAHPCGTWSPDGRWVALSGSREVWLVDTQTAEVRRAPGLRPIDLEWRPGTDELAIAGHVDDTSAGVRSPAPVMVYSVSTGELRRLGTVEAAHITWSPDGSTLAYTGAYEPPDVHPDGLWLVDADGTNARVLVADTGDANFGVGPVWNPTGEVIVYQRICCGRVETHEIVVVNVADGVETVIERLVTEGPDGQVRWWPRTVTWSPDGTTLFVAAWPDGGGPSQLLIVPADTPGDATVLADARLPIGFENEHSWSALQLWGRQPHDATVRDPSARDAVTQDGAATVTNAWIAIDPWEPDGADVDVFLVRPGAALRRLDVAGSETADESCPAWSPDGTRLMMGRLNGSPGAAVGTPGSGGYWTRTDADAELVVVPIDADGSAGDPTVIELASYDVLPGVDPHPCAIWAPDGRWVALTGDERVQVIDTRSGETRSLPDLRPTDLEWRPGTDQLTIAGEMSLSPGVATTSSSTVQLYTVSTGELHQLGSVAAAHITWSPDGSTLAYTGGDGDPDELWLVDADGTDPRLLVADTGRTVVDPDTGDIVNVANGIGPVWSPEGDRIAYQRPINWSEGDEVVLVDVVDGGQTVVAPPLDRWYPYHVTWAPDGTMLLYQAWSHGGAPSTLIAVRADDPTDVTVLSDTFLVGSSGGVSHRWGPTQTWGRRPG